MTRNADGKIFINKYEQLEKIPKNLLDKNARTGCGKPRFPIVENKKLNGNFDILMRKNAFTADLT